MGFRGGRWRAAPYIHYTKSVMLSSPVAGKRSSSSAGMSWNASMHCSQMGLRAAGGEVEPARTSWRSCVVSWALSGCTCSCNPSSASAIRAGIGLPVSRASATSRPFCSCVKSKGFVSIAEPYEEHSAFSRRGCAWSVAQREGATHSKNFVVYFHFCKNNELQPTKIIDTREA